MTSAGARTKQDAISAIAEADECTRGCGSDVVPMTCFALSYVEKNSPAGNISNPVLSCKCLGILTCWECSQHYTSNALIKAPPNGCLLRRTCSICFDVVLALVSSLDGIERIDQQVNRECCDSTSLDVDVREPYPLSMGRNLPHRSPSFVR